MCELHGSMGLACVAVGLPVYNGQQYVGEAIESILDQSYTDFELVISDNASEDETAEICRAYAERDPRIRYSRNPHNLGAAPNFNRCLELASPTKYFKWAAHDDLLTPDFLERCIEALENDPTVSVAFPRIEYIDADKRPIGAQSRSDLSVQDDEAGARAHRFVKLAVESPDIYWSVFGVIRGSALLRTRLHGSYIASDQVLAFELALEGKLAQVSRATFLRRAHPAAWTMRTDRTPESDAAWFDSRARPRLVLPYWRLFREHFHAISRSRLSRREKSRCRRAVAVKLVREWRYLAGDVKGYLERRIHRRAPLPRKQVGRAHREADPGRDFSDRGDRPMTGP